MSDSRMADIRAARENVVILPDSIHTFDKGYCDLKWIKLIADEGAFFIAYIKFLHAFKLTLTEIAKRICDMLMQKPSLLEVLCLDKKTIQKPPDWNLPHQPELFNPFTC